MSHIRLGLLSSVLLAAVWAGSARADASVDVELKDAQGKPADGEVSLHKKSGERVAGCTTSGGKCSMSRVPGGSYEVHVKPAQGEAPKPRSAMIPPDGVAKLIVSTASKGS